MISGEMCGWVGAIIGGLGGLAGGLTGTYFSIKNTNGPRERDFVIKAFVVCWGACLAFLGLLFTLSAPYRWLLWFPFGVFLPIGIGMWNKQQFAIRREEAQKQSAHGTH